jgi:hypothetical protein
MSSVDINTQLEAFLPCMHDFERMCDESDMYDDVSYSEFLNWNKHKISELEPNYRKWLVALMKMIRSDHVTLMDKEDCVMWQADGFFFDNNGKLCITHAR